MFSYDTGILVTAKMETAVRYSFLFVELMAVVFFFLGLKISLKRDAARAAEFFMIFVYGLLLEELDMKIFKTYHYGEHFLLMMGKVPLCIAMLWAVILSGAMAISDFLALPVRVRPFMDALLAVWIDLSLDAIAIRLGYWTWVIPLHEGWFGVPAGNLYAWMWVAFFYSAIARWVRGRTEVSRRWQWAYLAIPFLAYAGLFAAMKSVAQIGIWLGWVGQTKRLWLFAIQWMIFLAVILFHWKRRGHDKKSIEAFWLWSRYGIHLYFLLAYFAFQIYLKNLWVGCVAIFVLAGEIFFHRKWLARSPKS